MCTQKNRWLVWGSISLVFMIAAPLFMDATPAAAQAKPIELRWAEGNPAGNVQTTKIDFLAAEVQKRTGGRVKITVYPGETLCKSPESLNALASGIADGATLAIPHFPGKFPEADITNLPFFVANRTIATHLLNELYLMGLMKSFNAYHVLYIDATDAAYWYFRNKKVTKMEDLKGLKIRAPSGINVKALEVLGATPVSMLTQETPMAMERGIIDGLNTMPSWFNPMKMWENAKYCLWFPIFAGSHAEVMSLKAWNSLPPDVQVIIDRVALESQYWYLRACENLEVESPILYKSKGMEVYTLSPQEEERWVKAAEPIIDQWVKDMEAKGLPGKELVKTARGILGRYKAGL
jgi:TRAP-type transport system periplasmic protein